MGRVSAVVAAQAADGLLVRWLADPGGALDAALGRVTDVATAALPEACVVGAAAAVGGVGL